MIRILRHRWALRSPRQHYWHLRTLMQQIGRLRLPRHRAFLKLVWSDLWLFLCGGPVPAMGDAAEHKAAAVRWLLHAQAATPDDGVSLGYFPCDDDTRDWRPSYPETTGYIITSLIQYARRTGDDRLLAATHRMARWEVDVQMASGAVQGGELVPAERQTAAAFNTGMVLDGWCSVLEHDHDDRVHQAARRAADFLIGDVDERGYFRTNGGFVSAGEVKTYTCLCAWALYRFGNIVNEERYRQAAVRVVEAALARQRPNGWFENNCLTDSAAPLTHTIGYTLQGVLEVGVLANRPDFIQAVQRAVNALMKQIRPNGFLPGRLFNDWAPAAFSCCLTGSAQIAIVLYRLATVTQQVTYRAHADRLVAFLKALQRPNAPDDNARGAIAGSFPIWGSYMRAGYPNWATKYFLDALMLGEHVSIPAPIRCE